MLEVIRNHHYSKSSFLHGEKIREENIVFNTVAVDNIESLNITSSNTPVHLLNKFIIFDEQQEEHYNASYLWDCYCSAGSGKTSVNSRKTKRA